MAENLSLKINIDGQEKVIGNVRELRKAIRDAEFQALALTEQYGESDARVISIRESVGRLKNAMADATDQSKAFSEDSKFPAVAKSIQGLASGFTAVQGAMALMGVESEQVEKMLLKVNAAMAFSQGLGGVIESIDSFKILNSMIQGSTTLKKADIVVTRLATAAQSGLTAAVGTTTISLNALKTAIVSTGIGALVVGIGILVSKMIEWTSSTEDAEKANDELNKTIERQNQLVEENLNGIDFATKMQIANAKKRGASAKEISKIENDSDAERLKVLRNNVSEQERLQDKLRKDKNATKEQIEAVNKALLAADKQYNQEVQNQNLKNAEKAASLAEDGRKKAQDATDKANDKAKQKREKDQKEREDAINAANEIELEAFKSSLSEREREEFEANKRFIDNRAALQKAGITDFKSIEEQNARELAEIRKKYDEQSADEQQKKDELNLELRKAKGLISEDEYQLQLIDIKKRYASTSEELIQSEIEALEFANEKKKKLAEEEREISLSKLQGQLEDLDRKNQEFDFDFEQDLERFAQQREILAQQEAIELQNADMNEVQKNEIKAKYAAARKEITEGEVETERAAQQAKIDLNNQYLDLAGQFGSMLQQIAGKNKTLAIAGVVVEQVAAISKIISNTAAANAASVAASPLSAGMPFVAINTASAAMSIASTISNAVKSINQIKQSAGAGGQGSAGSGGAIPAPMGAQPPQVAETQLNQASINALGNQAIKAYVIESDMTTNQQRIAAIRQRARFS